MRKAQYDRKQVICKNSSFIGYSTRIAKPGYWIVFRLSETKTCMARVLGRIASCDSQGFDCTGWLAVMRLGDSGRHTWVNWVNPDDVLECYETAPYNLLSWLTGENWVKTKDDIERIVAMSEHGTTCTSYIDSRDDPEKPYNRKSTNDAGDNK